MDNKNIEQNFETILDSELSKADGDQNRQRLFEYAELVERCERISAEYPRVVSSRDKEELAAEWAYAENKRVLMEISFLESKMAVLQNRINKLSTKKQLDDAEYAKLQKYHSEYMFAEMQVINLQKHRTKKEIANINRAIKAYANNKEGLDLSFEDIKKHIAGLPRDEKKKFISNYADAGERFMILTETELMSIKAFGE